MYQIVGIGAKLDAKIEHKIVDRARLFDIGMHGLLRGAHAILGDAAIVAGEQHRPFGEWYPDRVIGLELDRQFYLAFRRVKTGGIDILFEVADDLGVLVFLEPCAFEVGRQSDQQFVGLAVRWANRLRIRAVERDLFRIDGIPDTRIGVGRLQRLVVETGDALDVRQRRHVHNRHAGHARFTDRVQQFANAGRAVLRLLHTQADQIILLRIDAGRRTCGHLAWKLSRFQQHRVFATAHRKLNLEALGIDEVGLSRKADEMNGMTAEQKLRGQQRAVGRAHQKNVVGRHYAPPGKRVAGRCRHRIGDASPSILMVRQCYWPHRTYAMHFRGERDSGARIARRRRKRRASR